MATAASGFCKSLFRCLCCCFKSSNANGSGEDERFLRVFPSISQETKLSFNCLNDDDFIHIPREAEIDKFINFHKDASKLSVDDALQAEAYIDELKKLNSKLARGRSFKEGSKPQNNAIYSTSVPTHTNMYPQFDTLDTEAMKPPSRLIIDVQRGRFFWPDELKKLRNPFVRVKIVSIKPNASNRSSTELSLEHDVLESYETLSSTDPINPEWNQTFTHMFDSIDMKSSDKGFRVSLVYYGENSEHVVIGSEQTFFLKELIDQQVKTKEVSFKHGKSLGLIAKVAIRLQFIHDEISVSKKVMQAIDYRLQQLGKLKNQHIDVFKQALQRNVLYASTYNAESKDYTPAGEGSYVFENGITMT